MSTDIKPGQIWAWNDTGRAGGPPGTRFEITEVTLDGGVVSYQYRDAAEFDPEQTFTNSAERITANAYRADREPDRDATPAPLDPSKVKAGDTVTVSIAYLDGSPVLTTSGETHRGRHHDGVYLGGWRLTGLPDYVTLTDHQPAPEPEPATSEIGDAIRELKHVVRTEDEIEGMALQVDDLWNRVQQHDPESVDLDALTTTFHNASHYGVNLPLEGAACLARVARTFFVGGEAR